MLTARWSEAVVRIIAHREIGVMTVRDYGADMMSVVRLVEPRVRTDRVRWGTLAGSDCAVAHGTAGETDVVAMCAALGVCRVIVVGSSPTGNADLVAEVESVMNSLAVA